MHHKERSLYFCWKQKDSTHRAMEYIKETVIQSSTHRAMEYIKETVIQSSTHRAMEYIKETVIQSSTHRAMEYIKETVTHSQETVTHSQEIIVKCARMTCYIHIPFPQLKEHTQISDQNVLHPCDCMFRFVCS